MPDEPLDSLEEMYTGEDGQTIGVTSDIVDELHTVISVTDVEPIYRTQK